MPRFKPYNYNQGEFIPIQFDKQIKPGSFEYALSYIVDHKLNVSKFVERVRNDDGGAPAYDPKIMLKIVIYAYSKGMLSSREIEKACQENVMFMALSANTRPHFTTIAHFISYLSDGIDDLFLSVLMYCDQLGLIGKEMFAIDGCKISSNASKEWSGTRDDFQKKKEKYKKSIAYLLMKHREEDDKEMKDSDQRNKEEKAKENMKDKIDQIDEWLAENEDKRGYEGKIKKSHLFDNESAKMVSSHGVIQGYNGIAVTDSKHHVIVEAEAHGEKSEKDVLGPMLDEAQERFKTWGNRNIYKDAAVTADCGFHNDKNMGMLKDKGIDAYVADNRMRKRDVQFETQGRHKNPIDRHRGKRKYQKKYFSSDDFKLNPKTGKLICPAGKELYKKSDNFWTTGGFYGTSYMAKITDCRNCEMRSKCLRHSHTPARQVSKLIGRDKSDKASFSQWMRNRIDTLKGRYIYSQRMGIAEPPFAHIRDKLGLNRFTMRGRTKNSAQWKMFTMVHNILKVYRYGTALAGAT
jgi:transposase